MYFISFNIYIKVMITYFGAYLF